MQDDHLISRIETVNGKVLASHKGSSKRVIDQAVADKMTSMMLGTFTNGTGYSADVYGYDIAGKTGTTETSFDVNLINDQWIIGYTPDLVTASGLGMKRQMRTTISTVLHPGWLRSSFRR